MSNKKAADSVHLQLTNMLDVNRTEEERLHIIDIFEVYDPTDRNKTIIVIDDNSKNILAFFSHVYGKNLSELVIANKKLDIQCNENKTYLMDYWTQGKLLSKSSIFPYNQSLMRKSFETYLKSHSKRVKNLLKDLLNKNEIEDFLKFRNISGYNYSEFYYNELLTLDESIKKLKIFLSWFREEFPYYRNKCDRCLTSGEFAGSVFPYEGELEYLASITEMYVCDKCESFSRFPRFNAVGKVLQTRKGRCGEYSSLIVRMLNVLNYKTRLVTDITDHLWGEANIHGNWYHIDPCEAAINEPYIYQGWGKNQTYILAFDTEINCTLPIEDVTSKYTTDIDGIHYRRNLDNMTTEKMNNLIQQEITNLRI